MTVMLRRAARLEQHEHGARAAVVRPRLTERDHFLFLHEPRAHFALEHRFASDRPKSLAVNHAQAAQPAFHRFTDKFRQRLTRFLAPHAVQVELRLHDPRATPELAHHFLTHAVAAVGEGVVGIEQAFGIVFVGERFVQDGFFIQARLQRQRRWRHARQRHAGRDFQRCYFADGTTEHIRVRHGFALGHHGRGALYLAFGRSVLERAAQRAESGEAIAFQGRRQFFRRRRSGLGRSGGGARRGVALAFQLGFVWMGQVLGHCTAEENARRRKTVHAAPETLFNMGRGKIGAAGVFLPTFRRLQPRSK